MKRIPFIVLKMLPTLPFHIAMLSYYAKSDKKTPEEKNVYLQKLVRKVNKCGRITIECEGTENIPAENGFILTPNHQGMYDVLTILETLNRPVSVVIKKELEKIPLLKTIFRVLDALAMDREDIRQSMGVIKEVTARVKDGENFVIFPEGTRSRQGNRVGSFKAGSFKSATRAKCPIVPVALIDCYKPFDEKSIAPTTAKIYYLRPLMYEEYQGMQTAEIAEMVQSRIEEKIAQVCGASVNDSRKTADLQTAVFNEKAVDKQTGF